MERQETQEIKIKEIQNMKYECPCCGYFTFPVPQENAIAYICPVCFWENDIFTSNDDAPSDENYGMTLNEGRQNFKIFGACSRDMLVRVRKPYKDELTANQKNHSLPPGKNICKN